LVLLDRLVYQVSKDRLVHRASEATVAHLVMLVPKDPLDPRAPLVPEGQLVSLDSLAQVARPDHQESLGLRDRLDFQDLLEAGAALDKRV